MAEYLNYRRLSGFSPYPVLPQAGNELYPWDDTVLWALKTDPNLKTLLSALISAPKAGVSEN